MALLEVENIAKFFGGVAALSDVNFGVSSGEIVGLIGPNGAGKTTLFNVATGFIKPNRGRILYENHVLSGFVPIRLPPVELFVPIKRQRSSPRSPLLKISPSGTIGEINLDSGPLSFEPGPI